MYDTNLLVKLGHDGRAPAPFEPHFTTAADLVASFNRYHQVGFWELDVSKKTVHWSREAFAIHGIDSNEGFVTLQKALSFYVPEDVKKVEDILRKSIAVKQGFQFKLRIKRTDNKTCVVEAIGDVKTKPEDGSVIIYGSFRDITSQTGFENSRIGQKDLILRMLKSAPIPAMMTDEKLRYIYVNDRFNIEFNLTEEQTSPRTSHEATFPDMPQVWRQALALALSGKPMALTRDVFQRAGGEKYLLDWVLQPWVAQTGQVGGVVMLLKIHKFFPRLTPMTVIPPETPQIGASTQPPRQIAQAG